MGEQSETPSPRAATRATMMAPTAPTRAPRKPNSWWKRWQHLQIRAWEEGRADGKRIVRQEIQAGRGSYLALSATSDALRGPTGALRPLALARGRDLARAAGLDRETQGKRRDTYASLYLSALWCEAMDAAFKVHDQPYQVAEKMGLSGHDWLN